MNRRTFLKHTSTLTAGAFFLTISENNIFASVINRENKVQKIPYVTLNNKVKMPCLGFGTLYLTGEKGVQCISDAIQAGYRLIDTARIYGNEEVVGMGVKQSGVERSKLFITSKLWVDDAGYESTKKAFEDTLIKLGTHYLDLYLIHRPRGDVRGSWTAMEELCRVGHLLYSRMWTKVLFDLGHIGFDEPFKKLLNQGMIQGSSRFVYRIRGTQKFVSNGLKQAHEVDALHVDVNIVDGVELDTQAFTKWKPDYAKAEFILEDGKYICGVEVEKMSKSKFNTVNPDDLVQKYGADTFRMYEMFLGPVEQSKP